MSKITIFVKTLNFTKNVKNHDSQDKCKKSHIGCHMSLTYMWHVENHNFCQYSISLKLSKNSKFHQKSHKSRLSRQMWKITHRTSHFKNHNFCQNSKFHQKWQKSQFSRKTQKSTLKYMWHIKTSLQIDPFGTNHPPTQTSLSLEGESVMKSRGAD